MASYSNGIMGAVSGKVGTVVGSSRNGVSYLRSAPKRRKKSKWPKEIANRKKIADAQTFLQPLLTIVRMGFNTDKKGQGFLHAKAWLLKNSFEGDPANQKINPALVTLSIGTLPLPSGITVNIHEAGKLEFSVDVVQKSDDHAKDQVMIVAYDIENRQCFGTMTGQFRYIGTESIEIPKTAGLTYHLYVAFISADRINRSDSVYVGEVTT